MSKAIAAGYTLQPATVTANSYMIGNVPYTRNVVKWVMDAKAGQVSPVLQDSQNDNLIVVALNDIVKPGYMPMNDEAISAALTRKVRNDKKAAAIIEQVKGKASDINGYARLLWLSGRLNRSDLWPDVHPRYRCDGVGSPWSGACGSQGKSFRACTGQQRSVCIYRL